jgi:hypothetical protein
LPIWATPSRSRKSSPSIDIRARTCTSLALDDPSPALDLRYVLKLKRTSVTFSVAPTYFHTESFRSSNANVSVNGDSESLEAKVDVDSPLGMRLFNHELHAGGYVSRADLFGGLRDGLDVSHLNEIHGRLVLDFMN